MVICPIRCFTCGKIMANKQQLFQKLLYMGVSPKLALDQLGIKRYCCRRMLLTHVELVDKILEYENENTVSNKHKEAVK